MSEITPFTVFTEFTIFTNVSWLRGAQNIALVSWRFKRAVKFASRFRFADLCNNGAV